MRTLDEEDAAWRRRFPEIGLFFHESEKQGCRRLRVKNFNGVLYPGRRINSEKD
ncbi:MAG TPA: hypothetical protein VFB27_12080 [Opitutaceae bacterium]|nr:hypothetical protein [Opitutaceae bacterium]